MPGFVQLKSCMYSTEKGNDISNYFSHFLDLFLTLNGPCINKLLENDSGYVFNIQPPIRLHHHMIFKNFTFCPLSDVVTRDLSPRLSRSMIGKLSNKLQNPEIQLTLGALAIVFVDFFGVFYELYAPMDERICE